MTLTGSHGVTWGRLSRGRHGVARIKEVQMHYARPEPAGQLAWSLGLSAVMFAAGCGGETALDEPTPIKTDSFRVAADPPGGRFTGPVLITLHAEVPATIYYTTNGDPPTASGTLYEGPFELEGDVMLSIAAVDNGGGWSKATVEHYEALEINLPPRESPRILSLSRPHVYFSARPGDEQLEQVIFATSVGSQHVLVHKVYLQASNDAGGFFEPGVFQLETPVPDNTLLAPGESLQLTVSYQASETLRSAALTFETDDLRTASGVHVVTLSGRIFNW